jgi:sortase A
VSRRRAALAAALLAAACTVGSGAAANVPRPLGRIEIPRIGLDVLFYNGQRAADTANGPSHYPWTGMPGQARTVAIAGHRVTHTHPFRLLGDLRRGDLIEIHWGAPPGFSRRACYRVSGERVVSPAAAWVTASVGVDRLVLTTCTPPGSSAYRLVVFARRARTCG